MSFQHNKLFVFCHCCMCSVIRCHMSWHPAVILDIVHRVSMTRASQRKSKTPGSPMTNVGDDRQRQGCVSGANPTYGCC